MTGVFFVGRLKCGVAVREQRARLPQSEPELAEETLALAHPKVDLELALEVGGEGLAVPTGAGESDLIGRRRKAASTAFI